MYLILLILLILVVLGALPQTGLHSYGYVPAGSLLGLILLIVLILFIVGRI